MNMKLVVSLVSFAALAGCAQFQPAQTPVGQTATTGGLICPQGYAPAADGQSCTASNQAESEDDSQVDVP
jgi:hypothetical protein